MQDEQKFLTKTDFKLGRECPTKLYYSKRRYPSIKSSDEYFKFLAEGGHIIGEMARVIHPEGIYIGVHSGLEAAAERTALELCKERVTLFEAVFLYDGMLAVVDILEKDGTDVNLIEVKSKSFDSREEFSIVGKKGAIKTDWAEYAEDAAFQFMILTRARPDLAVTPYLLLPDKSRRTAIDRLASHFFVERHEGRQGEYFTVRYEGDRERLRREHFLTRVNMLEACRYLLPLVEQEANRIIKSIRPELVKVQYHLGKHCRECEFRGENGDSDGYRECWGELADVKPHIFDLYFGGALKKDGKYLYDEMIAAKKVSLYDIPDQLIKGKRGERQSLQIRCTREHREWVNPHFVHILKNYSYPLHFIDFETAVSAVPYHSGMRPYEPVAFQWSCHTIPAEGEDPLHSEWINLEDDFPSFKFAKSLKETLTEQGTIFMWAHHENSILSEIRRQMSEYGCDDSDLASWLESVIKSEDRPGRLVDMNKLCLENYFHPEMKGRTSIKYTLPAIWNNNPRLWELPFLRAYVRRDGSGRVMSPYESLDALEISGIERIVKEGTGAMKAYHEMMYGISRDSSDAKQRWRELLLRYCKLDTMAMVIVYLHWTELCGSVD